MQVSIEFLRILPAMTLLVKKNPHFLFSADYSRGVSSQHGILIRFSPEQQHRLRTLHEIALPAEDGDDHLIKSGALIPEFLIEKAKENLEVAMKENLLSHANLIVMPTEQCNLRCTYCYEKFEVGGMSESIVSSIKNYLSKSLPRFKKFNLAWFGGEPLLQSRIVIDITSRYTSLLRLHETTGIASITTNGYFLNAGLINDLLSAGMTIFHITLDGPEELHDHQRRLPSGKGSYSRILRNIKELLKDPRAQLVLRININLSDESAMSMVKDWMTSELIPELKPFLARVKYYLVPIWEATTESINGICLTELDQFQRFNQINEVALKAKGQTPGQDLASKFSKSGALSCYAGKPNSYVVGADGSIYKCTVAFDHPDNRIGKIQSDGTLLIDKSKEDKWTKSNALTDSTCNNCSFAKSCQGIFCPLLRLQTSLPPCPTEKRFSNQLLNCSSET